jgi:hypothetical protein
MWYEEKVSNSETVVAKLKETLQNVKFATLCPERSVGASLWRSKIQVKFRSKYDSLYANFTPTLAYLWYLVPFIFGFVMCVAVICPCFPHKPTVGIVQRHKFRFILLAEG